MSVITHQLAQTYPMRHSLISVQAVLVGVCILLAWFYEGLDAALAASFGGAVALASARLLARSVALAGKLAKQDPNRSAYALYVGFIQRFLLVLVGLGVGLGLLQLEPTPMLVTFGIAQLAYMIAAGMQAYQKGCK